MCHTAIDAPVGARNALDGVDGAVRIVRLLERRLALFIHILRCNLPAYAHIRNGLGICIEAPLAMRYGDGMRIPDVHAGQPR